MLNGLEKELTELLSDAYGAMRKLEKFCEDNEISLMAAPNGPLFELMMENDRTEWLKVRDRCGLRLNEYLGREMKR